MKKTLLIVLCSLGAGLVVFLGFLVGILVFGERVEDEQDSVSEPDSEEVVSDEDGYDEEEDTETDEDDEGDEETAGSGQAVRLIFIHHSTGENWLADDYGGLGAALMDEGYFVSDTNYGWGTDSIGDRTDIGNWWEWFRGPDSEFYMSEVYSESYQNSEYSRLSEDPGGENEVIMFKSCFPNSNFQGSVSDSVPSIGQNPLKGESSESGYHTVANAKGIYIDLLDYFATKQDKLFVVITAPPVTDSTYAANAVAFNEWLVGEWLDDYEYDNVVVFDFFSVLTDGDGAGTLKYPSGEGDDHPSPEGSQKATEQFIPFLDSAYGLWKEG